MSGSDTLPRVLISAKLHRRPISDVSNSKSVHETQKHKCPPIEVTKDKYSNDCDVTDDAISRPLNGQYDVTSSEENCSPLSPADGASAACIAMANACSHDHDYLSVDLPKRLQDPANCSNFSTANDAGLRNRLEIKTVRVPVPPKPHFPTSPGDVKQRDVGSKLHRRYVRPGDVSSGRKGRPLKTHEDDEITDNTCIFLSTMKTAEPRKSRSRASRCKSRTDQAATEIKQTTQNEAKTRAIATASKDVDVDAGCSPTEVVSCATQSGEFDVTKDILTAEWLKMVQRYRPETNLDVTDDERIGKPLRQSTPVRDLTHGNETRFISPLPSATPCPPNMSRKSQRNSKNESDVTHGDSAYFSMTSSISSIRPTSSVGTPVFGSQARPQSGNRSAGNSRPPSGGKRVAITSLSSSSSCTTSSDDDYEFDLKSPSRFEDENMNRGESNGKANHSTASTDQSLGSQCGTPCPDHRAVKARKGKKIVRHIDATNDKKSIAKSHIRPIPPRKPKREPVPMHKRSLPLSFFQEPNKVSTSPYSVLPPVQPLFRQGISDDVADIRPVTPPDKISSQEEYQMSRDGATKVVIKTGDTDLLQRLFDAVEPQNQPTGIKVKRGRPKRVPRILPSPRLKLDDNPCIMQSITDKLFPKLTIERRCFTTSSGKTSVLIASDCENLNKHGEDVDGYNKELSQFGLLSFKSNHYDDCGTDVSMEIASPSPTSQRHEILALPHLPGTQDYSQMLSEVAAYL